MEENDKRFKQPWDINQPFETLVEQIDDAIDYATAGETPYTTEQILTNAYNLVRQTGMLEDACKEWRRKPAADKSWDSFQNDFGLAHTDYRQNQSTSRGAGFNQANQLIEHFANETSEAMANLAAAAASDREIVRILTSSNEQLTKQLAQKDKEISDLRKELARQGKNPGQQNPPAGRRETGKRRYNNNNYCWTHGFDCHPEHTSASCKNPGTGHIKEATKENNMGGSQLAKYKTN